MGKFLWEVLEETIGSSLSTAIYYNGLRTFSQVEDNVYGFIELFVFLIVKVRGSQNIKN